ncbi:type II secretion system secretin GspD [Parendozoicomonas haliclonae]|uniref:Type II secretion system protein D n=1 Tax=Parendozoicomonas haliclonae TaxID=1960125 RepID=A0A1X7AJ09_9GAMM|nr:type II secretion system secretin GspD [Parendozoicomonas haliclonae]SMA40021.1 Type II secretion system protein D precursor [Parendozoicomonas haliclonae]
MTNFNRPESNRGHKQSSRSPLFAATLLSTSLLCASVLFSAPSVYAQQAQQVQYSVNLQSVDIQEFINTVSSSLNKTIIIEPGVKGKITVRSYETLSAEQYYQFFQSVLEVHGYALVDAGNGVMKVIQGKKAKMVAVRVADGQTPGEGSEVVTWVMPLKNVPVHEMSPILRQLNDTDGSVVHFAPSNVLLLTGRANNVEKLVDIASRIDREGGKQVDIVQLNHASAVDMARILMALEQESGKKVKGVSLSIVPDEAGNRLVLSGTNSQISHARRIISRLDAEQKSYGNTRVFYLKYAKAEEIKPVLEGVGQTVVDEKGAALKRNFNINVHAQTNAVVVTAQPDMMKVLDQVIRQLDIRRAQVLVEAIIVEVFDGEGITLATQFASRSGGVVQFANGNAVPIGQIGLGLANAREKKGTTVVSENGTVTKNPDTPGDYTALANAISALSGGAFAVTSGDWAMLLQAVSNSTKSNVLATPSLMTLDNEQASFLVGDEVPTLTGATSSENNDNPFQTIERKDVGIKLEILPQVNEGDSVKLNITQEVSKINGTTPVDITFSTRQVQTAVMVGSGDTVIIGGLIDDDVQQSVSKVPLLGDIPGIGALFRSTSSTTTKRNLMVFIRPTIVRDDNVLAEISGQKYSFIRARQVAEQESGIALMPDAEVPVLPEDMSGQINHKQLLDEARHRLNDDEVGNAG